MNKIRIFDNRNQLEELVKIGEVNAFIFEGNKIAIAKTKSGFYAFKNECPHNRVALSGGKCNIYDEIVCPLHNYRFDLKTGFETSNHGYNLKTYNLEITDEGVYLTL